MTSVNKVILIGNLGQDPTLRYPGSGSAVCNMRLATNESYQDKEGKRQERTDWHRVIVWGKQAENVVQYLGKGRLALVEGQLRTRSWQDQQGNNKTTVEVQAQSVVFLPSGQGQNQPEMDTAPF